MLPSGMCEAMWWCRMSKYIRIFALPLRSANFTGLLLSMCSMIAVLSSIDMRPNTHRSQLSFVVAWIPA